MRYSVRWFASHHSPPSPPHRLTALLAVLPHERLLELEDGRVDLDGPVAPEDAADDPKGVLTHIHLLAVQGQLVHM